MIYWPDVIDEMIKIGGVPLLLSNIAEALSRAADKSEQLDSEFAERARVLADKLSDLATNEASELPP